MIIVEPAVSILAITANPLELIETAARTCYKSAPKKGDTTNDFIKRLMKKGHESVIEHGLMTVKFICSRGISHELVRHRLASFSQTSTRYVNYTKKDMEFIRPIWMTNAESVEGLLWINTMEKIEYAYSCLVTQFKKRPEEARGVLPNDLKTEVVMTANFREWRHILFLRLNKAAHPEMRYLMQLLLEQITIAIPVIFEDIAEVYLPTNKEDK